MAQRPEIQKLQRGLSIAGFDPGKIDGWWGNLTAQATKKAVDTNTGKQLVRNGVILIQEALEELGYQPGLIDGVWGPRTQRALSMLFDNDGLPVASAYNVPLLPPQKKITPVARREILQGSRRVVVRNLMLHTSATSGTWWRAYTNKQMLEEIRRWHTDPPSQGGRGWRDTGYHYVGFPDGEILEGRPETVIGAGAIGHNRGWIHVCMIPVKTITRMGTPTDYYTRDTIREVKGLVASIMTRTPIERIAGHNEVANKLCPGFIVDPDAWSI